MGDAFAKPGKRQQEELSEPRAGHTEGVDAGPEVVDASSVNSRERSAEPLNVVGRWAKLCKERQQVRPALAEDLHGGCRPLGRVFDALQLLAHQADLFFWAQAFQVGKRHAELGQ